VHCKIQWFSFFCGTQNTHIHWKSMGNMMTLSSQHRKHCSRWEEQNGFNQSPPTSQGQLLCWIVNKTSYQQISFFMKLRIWFKELCSPTQSIISNAAKLIIWPVNDPCPSLFSQSSSICNCSPIHAVSSNYSLMVTTR